jgi:DNA-binding NtrC family response regulator
MSAKGRQDGTAVAFEWDCTARGPTHHNRTNADDRMQVMVISAEPGTAAWLAERLAARGIAVVPTEPGPEFIRTIRVSRPQVAVLDRIDARPQLAPTEVAVLKEQSPGVRIIARSGESSELDAGVIEQGIYCYLGGCSLEELLRVVESAACDDAGQHSGETNLWGVP